jgi:hypothetical protein
MQHWKLNDIIVMYSSLEAEIYRNKVLKWKWGCTFVRVVSWANMDLVHIGN